MKSGAGLPTSPCEAGASFGNMGNTPDDDRLQAVSMQGPTRSSDGSFSAAHGHERRIRCHHLYSEGGCSKTYRSLHTKMLIEFLVQDTSAKDTAMNPCPQAVYT